MENLIQISWGIPMRAAYRGHFLDIFPFRTFFCFRFFPLSTSLLLFYYHDKRMNE